MWSLNHDFTVRKNFLLLRLCHGNLKKNRVGRKIRLDIPVYESFFDQSIGNMYQFLQTPQMVTGFYFSSTSSKLKNGVFLSSQILGLFCFHKFRASCWGRYKIRNMPWRMLWLLSSAELKFANLKCSQVFTWVCPCRRTKIQCLLELLKIRYLGNMQNNAMVGVKLGKQYCKFPLLYLLQLYWSK